MSSFEAWIGDCHLRQTDDAEYRCQVAVWACDYTSFHATLLAHIERLGYSIFWLEEVLPASQYLSRNSAQYRQIGTLAKAVHPGHTVELGPIRDIAVNSSVRSESFLVVEEIEDIEPLDGQRGVWPVKFVPDVLLEPLFGQPEPTEFEITHYGSAEAVPPMKTYAILDAAKFQFGLSEFEECDMPFRCLFKGDAAEELKDAAPYLFELEQNKPFTRRLFTHIPDMSELMTTVHLWHKEPGIYIRSRLDFDVLWRHFRKFTRIQGAKGNWFLWRFWEGRNLIDYLTLTEKDDPSKAYNLFIKGGAMMVSSFYVLSPHGSSKILVNKTPDIKNADASIADVNVLEFLALKASVRKFLENYLELEGKPKSGKEYAAKMEQALTIAGRYYKLGFKSSYHIGSLVYWSAALDGDFETPEIKEISEDLRSPVSDRFVMMAREIKRLHGSKVRNYRGRRNRALSA
ncbi:DUF4123 domain-containing protein [Thalassospira sp. TSL5-1]|uniref:DUF4123 domain-containing protein n=1 Tax=Thalassospira sp. TSL5-1 TaxID=1544451 RepID=UPI00093BEBD1|nr:DUF4123 domain-containing protein [Thalassospira sp. TSL5-1]OKH87847.1 hypothetical protein LF95_14080 [Thalassospira sp. TSL5-1]